MRLTLFSGARLENMRIQIPTNEAVNSNSFNANLFLARFGFEVAGSFRRREAKRRLRMWFAVRFAAPGVAVLRPYKTRDVARLTDGDSETRSSAAGHGMDFEFASSFPRRKAKGRLSMWFAVRFAAPGVAVLRPYEYMNMIGSGGADWCAGWAVG
jgi:hypothetical protein